MTKQEQTKFIATFIGNIKLSILEKIEKIPYNWDGFELRHYIAQKFDDENLLSRNKKGLSNIQKSRRRDCENDILVYNL